MLDVALFIATVFLVTLAITGYDQYIATKVRAKIVKERIQSRGDFNSNLSIIDPLTKMRVKKVKAAKVGSYLVITLVISDEGRGGERVEVDDPTLLLPLMSSLDEAEVTS